MRSIGLSFWCEPQETSEERKQREIRSLELQIAAREQELSRLRARLAEVS